jgi:hypothetical protein
VKTNQLTSAGTGVLAQLPALLPCHERGRERDLAGGFPGGSFRPLRKRPSLCLAMTAAMNKSAGPTILANA